MMKLLKVTSSAVITAALLLFCAAFLYTEVYAAETPEQNNPLAGDEGKTTASGYVPDDQSKPTNDGSDKVRLFSDEGSGNISYTINGSILTISGSGAMQDFSTEETASWTSCSSSATEIVIENGVTSIGRMAFKDFDRVTKVTIPKSLLTIGEAAFYGCSSLSDIEFATGSKLTTVDTAAFYGCSGLSSLTLPDTVESLGSFFLEGTSVMSFAIPLNTSAISGDSFTGSSVKEITVPQENSHIKSVDSVLFNKSGSDLLVYLCNKEETSYALPAGTKKICENAFNGAHALTSVDLSSVTTIGDSAFAFSGLKSVTLPDTVTSFGEMVFWSCGSLEYVDFGSGVKSLGYSTCVDCTSLKEIDFGAVTKLYNRAFYNSGIEDLVLPASLKETGVGAFADCTELESVTAKGLNIVAYQTFMDDTALSNVTLNEGLKTIYGYALSGCSSLRSLTIPKSCTFVHETAVPAETAVTNLNPDMLPYGYTGWVDTLTITGTRNYTKAYQVLDKVNSERSKQGLSALKMDKVLLEDAMLRAAETVVHFSHGRPNGDSVVGTYSWVFYYPGLNNVMGENIAYGSSTAAGVMDQWMNSSGHKANILDSDWETIGIGCFEYNGMSYWVQCFSTAAVDTDFAKPANSKTTSPIHIDNNPFEDAANDYEKVTLKFSIKGNKYLLTGKTMGLSLSKDNVTFNSNSVDWVSVDRSIAQVDGNGVVTGIRQGITTISAYSRGYKRASVTVTVGDEPQQSVAKASVSGISNKTYTGKAFTPAPVVKIGSKKLTKGTDYTVSYKSNKAVGTAKVIITGIGYYTGTKTVTFRINPKGTSLTKLKPAKKALTVKWKKGSGITGYQIQYSLKKNNKSGNKTVTVSKSSTVSKKIGKLKKKKKYYVRVRTFKTVSGTKYYSAWSKSKAVKTK